MSEASIHKREQSVRSKVNEVLRLEKLYCEAREERRERKRKRERKRRIGGKEDTKTRE